MARGVVEDVGVFGRWGLLPVLRGYQVEVARAVARAVSEAAGAGGGVTFTVVLPRQAGKNEVSAQLEAFLLYRYQRAGGAIVKAAPTFRPQLVTSALRLERMLAGRLTAGRWRRHQGHIYELGRASCRLLSAQPSAQIVGATASLLLEGDEAQDLDIEKWDRELVPMAATSNAPRVLYGTPWTDDTLLARQVALNLELERRDGVRRHFEVGWETVAEAVPAYRRHVEGEIARLGASHPIVRTQYLLQTMARGDRLLSEEHLRRLQGEHRPLAGRAGHPWGPGRFVAGIDVAGADEEDPDGALVRVNAARDSTVLLLAYAEEQRVEGLPSVDASGLRSGQALGQVIEPRLQVAHIYAWRGAPHRELYPVILALLRSWQVSRTVVDATGVGGGLAAFLQAALPTNRVLPWRYTAASKSQLGYDLMSAINADRVKLFGDELSVASGQLAAAGAFTGDWGLSTDHSFEQSDRRRELLEQAGWATRELLANQVMRWGVPESKGHDDLLNALALVVQAGPLAARRVASGRRAGSRV